MELIKDLISELQQASEGSVMKRLSRSVSLKEKQRRPGVADINPKFLGVIVTPNTVPDFTIPVSRSRLPSAPTRPRPQSMFEPFTSEPPTPSPVKEKPRFFIGPGIIPDLIASSRTCSSCPVSQQGTPMASPIAVRKRSEPCKKTTYTAREKPAEKAEWLRKNSSGFLMAPMSEEYMDDPFSSTEDGLSGTTNEDPLSLAALTLSHIKTRTQFGFDTLGQVPNTRRKESLYHGQPPSYPTRPPNTLSFPGDGVEEPDSPNVAPRRSCKRRNVCAVISPLGVVPLGTRSSSPSPVTSPCTPPTQSPKEKQTFQFSQQPETDKSLRRTRSLYLRPVASGEGRNLPDVVTKSAAQLSPQTLLAKTSAFRKHLPISRSSSFAERNRQNHREETGTLGRVEIMLKYERGILKVTLIKGEGIRCENRLNSCTQTFAKICLMPGKQQKQTSAPVTFTENPTFNEKFEFIQAKGKLADLRVRVSVLNRGRNGRDECVGKCDVLLEGLSLTEGVKLWCDLEPRINLQELGYLKVKLSFQPRTEQLNVYLRKARELPKHGITGEPDTSVLIELRQPGRDVVRCSTKVRRNTSDPQYEHMASLAMFPRIEDLNHTAVTLSVIEHGRLRSDSVLGQVRFGVGATEEAEISHWNHVLQNPGRDFEQWHSIMLPD